MPPYRSQTEADLDAVIDQLSSSAALTIMQYIQEQVSASVNDESRLAALNRCLRIARRVLTEESRSYSTVREIYQAIERGEIA